MKKITSLLLVLCLAVSCFAMIAAANDATEEEDYVIVLLNDEEVECDAEPFIQNDRTMVGLRGIFEQMGAEVQWNAEERSVLISDDSKEVKLIVGDKNISITENGETALYEMDTEPVIVNDRTYVPQRFVAEAFDCKVDFFVSEKDGSKIVIIYTPDYEYTNMLDVFETTYEVKPLEDEALPQEENVFYYELDDNLYLPMGKDHLIDYQKAIVKNYFCTYAYDDVTGWFNDGGWTNNEYSLTKYNESIHIAVITDPRAENPDEDSHFVVTDGKLGIVGTPIVKVVYTPSSVNEETTEEETKNDETETEIITGDETQSETENE